MPARLSWPVVLLILSRSPAMAEHPSIFLTPDDVPRLRDKAKLPEMKPFADALMARCEYLLKVGPIKPPAKASTSHDRSGGELGKAGSCRWRWGIC